MQLGPPEILDFVAAQHVVAYVDMVAHLYRMFSGSFVRVVGPLQWLQLASVGRRPCGGPPGGGDGVAAPGPLFLLQCEQDVPADRLPVVGAPVQRAGSRVLKNCLLGLPYACCGLLID